MAKPPWLKIRLPSGEYYNTKATIGELGLNTVCTGAHCPNASDCWSRGTATFMILGNQCTRGCRFCAVEKKAKPAPPDPTEPQRLLEAAKRMRLKYVVLTSVTRDDLPDGGASHFAECISALKQGGFLAEALIPDFQGNAYSLASVLSSSPSVLAHNIETVERLQKKVRDPRASYKTSLGVLANSKKLSPSIFTKSSLMLGLGEKEGEILQAMDDLLKAKCDILTLGQYLQPTPKHLPVEEFVTPEKFEELRLIALKKGFSFVASGPFVRSSFKASEAFKSASREAL